MLHRNNAYVSSENRKKRVINGIKTTRHIIRKNVVLKPISKIILLFYSLPRAEASASRSSVVLHVYVIFFFILHLFLHWYSYFSVDWLLLCSRVHTDGFGEAVDQRSSPSASCIAVGRLRMPLWTVVNSGQWRTVRGGLLRGVRDIECSTVFLHVWV